MKTANEPAGATLGFRLQVVRDVDAPRELVFRAWTERERLTKWFFPKDFDLLFFDGELRPGESWRSGMRSPEGREYVAFGEFREIAAPHRLVLTHQWEEEPSTETIVTVTFADVNGKTRMTMEQVGLPTAEIRDSHSDGWNEAMDNLVAYLAEV